MKIDSDSDSEARISVALVTRNRPASLERALRSWRRQSVQPLEIIISDDSEPQYEADVQRLALRYNSTYVRGPREGLYANRNHVVGFCSGTHILSADDDHEHPIDYLDKIQNALHLEPKTIWCMGELYSWQEFEDRAPWCGPGHVSPYGSLWPVPADTNQPCWAISDGATLYPREVFDFGFRFYDGVRFGDSYKEFGSLLFFAGWRIKVLASTGVIHHIAEVGRSYENCLEQDSATFFAMFMLSFYYQRTLRNVLITTSKIGQLLIQRPVDSLRIMRNALRFCKRRIAQVNSWLACVDQRDHGLAIRTRRLQI